MDPKVETMYQSKTLVITRTNGSTLNFLVPGNDMFGNAFWASVKTLEIGAEHALWIELLNALSAKGK